jgi:Fibronectin-attachment protein (FAP)
MKEPEGTSQRTGLWTTLAMTAIAGAGAVALTLPMTVAYADPPAPPPDTTTAAPPPAPADPNAAPAPAPVDPNAAPDLNAPPPPPEPGRINVPAGGFSYVLPAGWTAGDASRVSYGQAVLLKTPQPGQPPPADTSVLLGKLDLRLFAGAEQDDQKAAIRLASDMGEFYMPFPGTRINQQTGALNAGGMPGAAAYYEVKFTDPNKPNGQIWAAALGTVTPRQGATPPQNNRWFVVWLGSANNPIDTVAAKALAESVRPYTPPPAPEAPPAEPGAPAAPPAPNGPQVGVPVPVAPENAPGMTPPA